MDFFDKLGKKASETYKATAEITGRIAKETKLKFKMGELKEEINQIYGKIGKKVIEKHELDKKTINIEEDMTEEVERYNKITEELKTIEEACLVINGKKKCPNCDTELEKDIKFCPQCGTEQPEQKKADEEIIIEAEVVLEEEEETKENKESSEENVEEEKKESKKDDTKKENKK